MHCASPDRVAVSTEGEACDRRSPDRRGSPLAPSDVAASSASAEVTDCKGIVGCRTLVAKVSTPAASALLRAHERMRSAARKVSERVVGIDEGVTSSRETGKVQKMRESVVGGRRLDYREQKRQQQASPAPGIGRG